MKAGWKNDIQQRMYFEAKRMAWRRRCWEQRQMEMQLFALKLDADEILARVQEEVMNNKEPRH